MNTMELLNKLNFESSQMNGFYVDSKNPSEFVLSVFKDSGAERWRLYGDKENFVVALGSDSKHQVISVCPIEDAIHYVSSYLAKTNDAENNLNGLNEFIQNHHKSGIPEELYSESGKDFLAGSKSKTLKENEIKYVVNKFRVKSGYDATFDLSGQGAIAAVKGNINSIRNSAFGSAGLDNATSFKPR